MLLLLLLSLLSFIKIDDTEILLSCKLVIGEIGGKIDDKEGEHDDEKDLIIGQGDDIE